MWVFIALAGLATIIFLTLCVPLNMALHADVYGKPKLRLKLVWLFGLVSKEITEEKKTKEKKRELKEKRKPEGEKKRFRDIFEILRTKGLLKQLKRLLKNILSCFRIKDFIADFKIGLGDPADTGLLFSFIGPATFWLNSSFHQQIRVQPSFEDKIVFEGYSFGKIRVQPIQLVIPCLRFAFSLTTLRLLKRTISTRWTRKK